MFDEMLSFCGDRTRGAKTSSLPHPDRVDFMPKPTLSSTEAQCCHNMKLILNIFFFFFHELQLENDEFPAPVLRATYLHERLPPSALCLQSISPLRLTPFPGSTVLFEAPNNITETFAGCLNVCARLFCPM